MKLSKIRKAMKKKLSEARYEHTLGVAYTAGMLASVYGLDVEKAKMAGMLHDCAKWMTDEELVSFCDKKNIEITEAEKLAPYLLHAKVGAYLAEHKYEVSNPDIIHAISCHTTGKKAMNDLEKIIFIADYIEPGRKHHEMITTIRKLAFQDLDRAIVAIYQSTLTYLETGKKQIDPITIEAYEYYKQIVASGNVKNWNAPDVD